MSSLFFVPAHSGTQPSDSLRAPSAHTGWRVVQPTTNRGAPQSSGSSLLLSASTGSSYPPHNWGVAPMRRGNIGNTVSHRPQRAQPRSTLQTKIESHRRLLEECLMRANEHRRVYTGFQSALGKVIPQITFSRTMLSDIESSLSRLLHPSRRAQLEALKNEHEQRLAALLLQQKKLYKQGMAVGKHFEGAKAQYAYHKQVIQTLQQQSRARQVVGSSSSVQAVARAQRIGRQWSPDEERLLLQNLDGLRKGLEKQYLSEIPHYSLAQAFAERSAHNGKPFKESLTRLFWERIAGMMPGRSIFECRIKYAEVFYDAQKENLQKKRGYRTSKRFFGVISGVLNQGLSQAEPRFWSSVAGASGGSKTAPQCQDKCTDLLSSLDLHLIVKPILGRVDVVLDLHIAQQSRAQDSRSPVSSPRKRVNRNPSRESTGSRAHSLSLAGFSSGPTGVVACERGDVEDGDVVVQAMDWNDDVALQIDAFLDGSSGASEQDLRARSPRGSSRSLDSMGSIPHFDSDRSLGHFGSNSSIGLPRGPLGGDDGLGRMGSDSFSNLLDQ